MAPIRFGSQARYNLPSPLVSVRQKFVLVHDPSSGEKYRVPVVRPPDHLRSGRPLDGSILARPLHEFIDQFAPSVSHSGARIPFTPFPARDYQEWAIQAFFKIVLEYRDRGLIVLPTGTGKTITFADLVGIFVAEFPNPLRTLVISHREEILDQNAKKIGKVIGEENVGIVQGEREDWDKPVVMASIQTLIQKDPALLNQFDLIVLDEAHHYVHGNEWFTPLVHLGFFTPEGEIVNNPNGLLVGFTATPDRFTGKPLNTTFGVDGMIFEKDITWMIDRSHLLQPYGIEVNLEVPGANNPVDALKMASPEEKGRIISEIFYDRLHHGDKFKRTMVFVSPRVDQNSPSEVGIVTEYLNSIGIRAAGITDETVWKIENGQLVRINGGQAAKARKKVIEDYKAGKYDALVNVNIATEGFDDEGTEAVIVARAIESRGMFVQIIGRALRPDPDHPERTRASLVDLGSNLRRHKLNINIREIYQASQGKLKPVSPDPTGPTGPRGATGPRGQAAIEDFKINDLGQIVPGSRRSAFSIVLEELLPTPEAVQALAYRLGKPSDELFDYYNNNSLPLTFEEASRLSQAMNNPSGKLLDAWANDQTTLFAQEHPIPDALSGEEKEILSLARFGFYRYQRGEITRAKDLGTTPDTLWIYLTEGKIPSRQEQNLYQALARLISKPGEEETGLELLRSRLGVTVFGESFRPKNVEEVQKMDDRHLRGLFKIVKGEDGKDPEVILLQFLPRKDGALVGFTAVRPGEENKNTSYGKIQIRHLGEGRWEVEKGWSSGLDDFIKALESSTIYEAKNLTIRSRGWLRLGTEGRGNFCLEDVKDLRGSDLSGFGEQLRGPDGKDPEVILLQFRPGKDGALEGFTAVRPGEENKDPKYGFIQIRHLGEGRWEVEKGWGTGSDNFIKALESSTVYEAKNLTIRSRGWLRLGVMETPGFCLEDVKDLRGSDLSGFREQLRGPDGKDPEVILLQFHPGKNGALGGFTAVRPGEENKAVFYGKIQIRYLGEGRWEVEKGWGAGSDDFIKALESSAVYEAKNLTIRSRGWLRLGTEGRGNFCLEDVKDLRGSDLSGFREQLRGPDGKDSEVILLQFCLKKDGALQGFTAVRPGEENKDPKYGKIQIRCLGDGRWEVEKRWGTGSDDFIKALESSTVYEAKNLTIRSRGWLRLGIMERGDFRHEDVKDLRGSDLSGFREQLRGPDGKDPEVILLQFRPGKDGALTGFTAVRPGEENADRAYCKIQIHYLGEGRWEVTKIWGGTAQGHQQVLETLSQSPIAQGEEPVLRIELEQ